MAEYFFFWGGFYILLRPFYDESPGIFYYSTRNRYLDGCHCVLWKRSQVKSNFLNILRSIVPVQNIMRILT